MDQVEMKLLKAHTHEGLTYRPGDTIKVPSHTVNWLVENEIAEKAGLSKPAPKDSK